MSSTLIDAQGITRSHGARTVLDRIALRVGAEDRIALVGPNGAGKSTLLRILAGIDPPDAGSVRHGGTVALLAQEEAGADRRPAREVVRARIGVTAAERELALRTAALDRGGDAALDRHREALERWVAVGGADADARIGRALEAMGVTQQTAARPLATLSPGQAARVGLAAIAAAEAGCLLLDEPTSHLDGDGLDRLRVLLRARRGGVVLVSHDRDLLAEWAKDVVALDPEDGGATRHGGGWAAYEHERIAAHERARAEHEHAREERGRLVAAERETRRRAAASRRRATTRPRDNDKTGRNWAVARSEERDGRARRIGTRADRVRVPPAPTEPPRLRLDLDGPARAARWVLALEGVVADRGAWRLGPLDLALARGDRVLLEGPNGCGKSTLLDLLAGDLTPTKGRRALAPGVRVARLGQARDGLGADEPLAVVAAHRMDATPGAARTALSAFGLGADIVARPAAGLSPGERTRAELAVAAHARAGCLLLDEPSNHLDVPALEVLEEALAGWDGVLVVATHDRRLARSLRLERRVALG